MNLKKTDLLWIVPLAFIAGAILSSLQPGNWFVGFASFFFLFLVSFLLFALELRWVHAGKTFVWILALTVALRFLNGSSLYTLLPIYGHENEDHRAGYVFTDAHRRDDQAWKLATSEQPILNAFSEKYASDQYGGLLAFSALVYRYLSPDAQRPLMLILLSAVFAAFGVPFFWKAVSQTFGKRMAWVSTWIFALYPESILLGSAIMREPYLLTFSAMAFWGFVEWRVSSSVAELPPLSARVWLGLGLFGMLLVSPVVVLFTLVIFAGWMFFSTERANISWKAILTFAAIFVVGLFFLSAALNRSGEFDPTSPLHVINDWLRLAVRWDAYQLERDSGWVQKIFDEGPAWIRLPFVTIYGVFQPVLPATIIYPTEWIWRIIGVLRALGWYALLPMLILSFVAAAGQGSGTMRTERNAVLTGEVSPQRHSDAMSMGGVLRKGRSLVLWLSLLVWTWILLAALRGGGDLWDNPRYRVILLVWQALLAGYVWVWWQETRSAWPVRVIAMEVVFLLIFTQWYANRYFHWGGQLPFFLMIGLILALWGLILGWGWWQDQKSAGSRA